MEWTRERENMWVYFTEQVKSRILGENILSLLNVDANLSGCVVLASLFLSFRDHYVESHSDQATETELVDRFMAKIRSLEPTRV